MIPICEEIEALTHPVQLKEDEYLDESGLICCSKCHTPDRNGSRPPEKELNPDVCAHARQRTMKSGSGNASIGSFWTWLRKTAV